MIGRITDTVKQDHREIEACYQRIINGKDRDEQTRYQNLFTWELARHSIGEELVVYPAFEKHLSDGIAMADKDRREHQTVLDPPTSSDRKLTTTGQRKTQEIPEPGPLQRRVHSHH
jgi:hemerythrin superfamily protein